MANAAESGEQGTRREPDGYCIVITTCDSERSAEQLAEGLVEDRLAACVQIQPIESLYRWEGRVERAREMRLAAKTHRRCLEAVEAFVRRHHPYEVPELVVVPIEGGLPAYLDWVGENVG